MNSLHSYGHEDSLERTRVDAMEVSQSQSILGGGGGGGGGRVTMVTTDKYKRVYLILE